VKTYLDRDVKEILGVRNISGFNKFLRLLAIRTGSILNLSAVAKEAEINFETAKEWLAILESSGIVFLLRPYSKNFKRRIVKSPKIYLTDTGLLCHFLGIKTEEKLRESKHFGNIFENFIIIEYMKKYLNKGRIDFEFSFFRDNNYSEERENEIDLIDNTEYDDEKIYEIKSGRTGKEKWTKNLNRVAEELKVKDKNIIYRGDRLKINDVQFVPWNEFL
jgi:predicted AAA+ superfamily ATPase